MAKATVTSGPGTRNQSNDVIPMPEPNLHQRELSTSLRSRGTSLQETNVEHSTTQSTMARLPGEGEVHAPIVTSRVRPIRGDGYFGKCVIRLLERDSPTSATVAWSDSTSCFYGAQLWWRGTAKKAGVCSLSGQTIARGDAVYRPRRVQHTPRNVEAMILAIVLETLCVEGRI
jgi:hypothetical protein